VEFLPVLVIVLIVALVIVTLMWRRSAQRAIVSDIRYQNARRELLSHQETLQSLRASIAQYADAAYDAILVVDSENKITVINEAACELFGVKDQSTAQTLMGITRNHELDAMVQAVLRGEPVLESQLEIQDRSLKVRCMAVSTPRQTTVVVALQDITELLRLTRARREMVANFSHDLRTPISSIRLLVDTLTTNYGKNAERDRKSITKIAGETDSLQHMMQELIDLSMIESGKAIIRMIPVQLITVVNEALNIMDTQLEQKKLKVENEIDDNITVLIDPEQTRRVIMNVLHNSIKFTPTKGTISFLMSVNDHHVTVRIKDTGVGIPPQDRTRIFERFYQVDTSRTGHPSATGSGLGLSIAKHIIEAQGGRIWAEAGIPTGAVIAFTLPLAETKNGK
jgi:two-component system, OmpR family, phosphate regulon sensor histidine kinase PhoR